MTRAVTIRAANQDDRDAAQHLLADAGLVALDATAQFGPQYAVAVDEAGAVVGLAGYERYDGDILLRSVVVKASRRGEGIGARLAAERFAQAASVGCHTAFLLTQTARDYWARVHGFVEIPRANAPVSITQSVEWTEACPASAVAMRRRLIPE